MTDDLDWYVAGAVDRVPWIGRRTGQAGAADFYRQIRALIVSERFVVSEMLTKGNRVVVLGEFASRPRATGKLIETEFAFDVTVEIGAIVRFRLFEDSHAVAQAVVRHRATAGTFAGLAGRGRVRPRRSVHSGRYRWRNSLCDPLALRLAHRLGFGQVDDVHRQTPHPL